MPSGNKIYEIASKSVARLDLVRNGERISSGSAFVVGSKLVTCAHVVPSIPGVSVHVVFEKAGQNQTSTWSYQNIGQAIVGYSAEQSFDFAVLQTPTGSALPSNLEWAQEVPQPGEPVCMLGYPFEEPHLTLHQGFVSAVFQSGPATMLKLDMSVNPSNSGGPLLRLSDGRVLGMIARKATGLTQAFDALLASFDQNIAVLQAASFGGGMTIQGIDPIESSIIAQRQMRQVSLEIRRSANVGIGYAIWNVPLRNEPSLNGTA